MIENNLIKVFLSAGIPDSECSPRYYISADNTAIRQAVKALATMVIPQCTLIWGGHPAITPLIQYVLQAMNVDIEEHVIFYQKDSSDTRNSMLSHAFSAGVFIGGMEDVEEEYILFKEKHPTALVLPIASTGGAALEIYNKIECKNERLLRDYAYMSLFQDLLNEIMGEIKCTTV
jgi:hypothetical protein